MRKAKYGYLWVTLALFLVSLGGHWACGWYSYRSEAREHGQTPKTRAYLVQMGRDTLENWQSEFLQLIWQVCGLSILLFVGSPESREGNERLEAKVDYLMSPTPEGRAKRSEIDVLFLRQ